MNFFKRWYVLLALSLLAVVLLAVILIIFDQKQTGNIIFETSLPGTARGTQSATVYLEESTLSHVLVVEPEIESGWGEPDVFMTINLIAPDGEILVSVGHDTA